MFTVILVEFVAVFLFTCLSFFMLSFIVLLLSVIICKQVHSFVFVTFVYNCNVKRCKTEISVFFNFRNNVLYPSLDLDSLRYFAANPTADLKIFENRFEYLIV